ncbi:PAS domain-containing protein [Streptomyces kunmingensis]|uniref:PAS domain-containing protein n=1 Tax=Streptomyces kunmingensis TaxID=68225 RepID=A0ABU6C791_9ACTN|nr:PAS domain-containing protein [Streptomyces kunmingensis]MEB3960584.1 PAS domain-containing protein [Streptomyces kunmingensis]
MHEVLRATSSSQLFEATTAPYVVLDTHFRIQGVNPAYLAATGRTRQELLGAFMFDAFPDAPRDATATGVRNLTASLEQVLRYKSAHDMGIQRYDIPDSGVPGAFRRKAWTPVNSPLSDADGRVVGALHHVEDVTAVHDVLSGAHRGDAGDAVPQAPLVQRVLLALNHYEQAIKAAADGSMSSRDFTPPTGAQAEPRGSARRDTLWHEIVHAAEGNRAGDCAAAVCAVATQHLPRIDAAVISLHGGALLPVQLAVSSSWGRRAEELHFLTGEGPALTAFRTGKPVLVSDLGQFGPAGARWPLFTEAAGGLGVGAAFAYPLRSSTTPVGTLTLYRKRGATPGEPPADAQALAEIAAHVLLADQDYEIIDQIRSTADEDDLNVAAGVVAAARGMSVADALAWLHTTARAQGRTVGDLARFLLMNRP